MPQDARRTWDRFNAAYNFDATTDEQVTESTTFGEAYSGSDFATDFNGILTKVDEILRPNASAPPGYGENDLMLGSLKNYPDNPGPTE